MPTNPESPASDNTVFERLPKLTRSPPAPYATCFTKTPSNENAKKRLRKDYENTMKPNDDEETDKNMSVEDSEEVTMADLKRLITNSEYKHTRQNDKLFLEMVEIKSAMNKRIERIEQKIESNEKEISKIKIAITSNNEKSDSQYQSMKQLVNENTNQINYNMKAINHMRQERLQNLMEIHGLADDLKREIIKIIKSFNIAIEIINIKSASMIEIKSNNPSNSQASQSRKIIIVEFDNFETNARIMKQKRAQKEHGNVFFNHRLIPEYRILFGKAKKVAKEKNFKAYLNFNKIYLKKSDALNKIIECEADIDDTKYWDANPQPTQM